MLLAGLWACNGALPQMEQDLLGAAHGAAPAQAAAQEANGAVARKGNAAHGSVMAPSAAVLSALGGSVITTPQVKLISFNQDADAASVQNFLVAWAHSGVWAQMTAEYGVGALTVLEALDTRVDWAPTVSDGVRTGDANTDIESALVAHLDGPTPAWGEPDGNTVYVLAMPQEVAIAPTAGAQTACDANTLAWHGAVTLPNHALLVPYIVLPSCTPTGSLTRVDSKTFALSHTLVGAVTDPTGQGYAAIDAAHAAWQLAADSPEASDLCNEAMHNSSHVLLRVSDVPQALARTWSNVEAKRGHPPCVPALDGEQFFAAAPLLDDAVEVALGPDTSVVSATTRGLSLGAGAQKDVPLELTSYPTNAGAFSVVAEEVGTQDLTLGLSANLGAHGQILVLTVGVATAPQSAQQVVRITASRADTAFSQYFVVRQPRVTQE